jgi:transcriptional regulator with XRE-family HTH domain
VLKGQRITQRYQTPLAIRQRQVGITRRRLKELIGLSPGVEQWLEQGERPPTASELERAYAEIRVGIRAINERQAEALREHAPTGTPTRAV